MISRFALLPLLLTAAADPDPSGSDFFESRIRPVLVESCYACHSTASRKSKGGLRVDTAEALRRGGDSGAAIVPGKPEESRLLEALRYTDETLRMPPKGKLPDRVVADFERWIISGAADPRGGGQEQKRPAATAGDPATHWAFRPIAAVPPPAVKETSWPRTPIDHFLLNPLEARGIKPAPPADKRTLIRRATFDLIGLPPTPAEIDAFLADDSPDAFARVVERLLASPHYGERWGRHWLDVARYADSNGMDENLAFANAFRYRDYVVAAFNRDMPYDRFVREQVAGDILAGDRDDAGALGARVATGFLVIGPKMLAEDDPVKMEMDIVDEQVDTVGRTFLGMTLGCARCHDHKFDPISTADYYALAGIFKSTKTMDNFRVVARWHERPLAGKSEIAALEAHQKRIAEKKAERERRVREANDAVKARLRRDLARYLLAASLRLDLPTATPSPLLSRPEADRPSDLLVVEAERFDRGDAWIETQSYGAGIGIIATRGPMPCFVEYDVTLPNPGAYQLELRYAAAGSRPVRLLVNGQLVKSDAAREVTGTWFPDSQAWKVEGVYLLPAGKNTIRLERDQVFPHIDKLALVPRPDPGHVNAPRLTSERLRDDWTLDATVLDRWVQLLKNARDDARSVFHAWHLLDRPERVADTPWAARLWSEPRPAAPEALADRYARLFDQAAGGSDAALEPLRQILNDPKGPFALPEKPDGSYPKATREALQGLAELIATLEKKTPQVPETMAVEEQAGEDLRVHIRGSHLTLGPVVPRGFPRLLSPGTAPTFSRAESGRAKLAEWLTRPDQPLTSRVMVNRIWHWHFGRGLVRSPDNFGRLGETPTNPALLDWLARRFVEEGWSVKAMHRLIMDSAAYQMSSAYDARAAEEDPEDRLHWRWERRRLEAEAVRDAVLAVSGRLDPTLEGSLLTTKNRAYVASTNSVNQANYQSDRRSIYLPVVRSALFEAFQAFDFADPSVPNGMRETTTVAPQALFMMNSAIVAQNTRHMADALLHRGSLDDAERVRTAYETALGRPPSAQETSRALAFVHRYEEALGPTTTDPGQRRLRAWQGLCRVIVSSNEFLYVE